RCSTFAIAATPTSFTLEQVMSSPFPSELVAASHATRVAWAFNAKGVRNIWVADGTDFAARQVTHYGADDGEPLASLRITPDGRQIVFVSNRADHGFIAIYDFGRDTVRYIAPSADRDSSPRWSLDGRRIAFLRIPGVRRKLPLIPLRITPWGIWVADPASGKAGEIWHSGSKPDDSFPELSADASFNFAGKDRVIFSSEQDGRNHLY